MISLNEAHNMEAVLDNIAGWAQEVFLVDSYSSDETVDIALSCGANVVQRPFKGFGDQWSFAVTKLPVSAPWTMKLDPDERLTLELKTSIEKAIADDHHDALIMQRRLWFMGKPMPVRQKIMRLWRTGTCRFSDVAVNEHPLVEGQELLLEGDLEHHDSPDLHHWYSKQNKYSTAEALTAYRSGNLAATPKIFGDSFQRRIWIKKNLNKIPLRYLLLFLYHYIYLGTWRVGRVGYIWSILRVGVYQARDYKLTEMQITGKETTIRDPNIGKPDDRVPQY